MADGTGGGSEGAALLRALESVWSFDDVGRGISYLIMGRQLETACVRQFDPDCACLVCEFDALLGSPPRRLAAPYGESQAADPARENLSALPQVKDGSGALPRTRPRAARGASLGRPSGARAGPCAFPARHCSSEASRAIIGRDTV